MRRNLQLKRKTRRSKRSATVTVTLTKNKKKILKQTWQRTDKLDSGQKYEYVFIYIVGVIKRMSDTSFFTSGFFS